MTASIDPSDLWENLKVAYGVTLDEELRDKTRARSFRTLQRWKSEGWPQNVEAALTLLDQAGLLRAPADVDAPAEQPRRLLAQLGEAVEELVSTQADLLEEMKTVRTRLERAEAALTQSPDAPKRKRARGAAR